MGNFHLFSEGGFSRLLGLLLDISIYAYMQKHKVSSLHPGGTVLLTVSWLLWAFYPTFAEALGSTGTGHCGLLIF